ncbi:hypothetical protein QQF64_014458 [Cirrhinus molitorella]|uniref:Type III endosome membrane protein TEMP n=1 Tax=Cirrhinus molitorella TaxID=172907 RepID=A0ABR3NS53_9TELE
MVLVTYLVLSAHECLTSQEHQAAVSTEFQLYITSDGPNATESSGITEAHSAWPIVLGALTVVFSICFLIALAVRYRFIRWCLTRHRHTLLFEGETASRFDQVGDLEGQIPVRGMRGRMIGRRESSDYDDDGFIEDNYIQASQREKAEEEEIQHEDAEDSDDELLNPDTI